MGTMALIIDKVYRATAGRLLLNLANKVIAFDQDYSEDYQKFYGVSNEKIRIVPNGIDYSYYSLLPNGDELRETLGNPEQVILYIGRFIDYKKPDLLIASFRLVSDYFPKSCLLMIGKDYGLLSYCRKLASDFGLKEKVVFIEDATEKKKLQALSIADICVIPSDYEAGPIVALEAQASGVPLVASRRGGLKYLLEEMRTGLFLKERTAEEIAAKIVFLLKNDGIRKKMGSDAKEYAKKFSWERVGAKLIEVYEEVQES
jgi:glycosyltransferase involved in cell wall biosynthesis